MTMLRNLAKVPRSTMWRCCEREARNHLYKGKEFVTPRPLSNGLGQLGKEVSHQWVLGLKGQEVKSIHCKKTP